MSKRERRERLPPFVPLLKSTLASPAWRAMSHGARSLYVALKAFYNQNSHNNGKVFLSTRDAAETIGSGTEEIVRRYRELQHYKFIVQVTGGCLGASGEGFAPHWRLTELGYMRRVANAGFFAVGWRQVQRTKTNRPKLKSESRTGKAAQGDTERRHAPDTERRHILSLPLVRPTASVSWPPSITQEVLNIVEEQLHDLDPTRVRARKRAELARLQCAQPLKLRRAGQSGIGKVAQP